jgi:hypothetical protein
MSARAFPCTPHQMASHAADEVILLSWRLAQHLPHPLRSHEVLRRDLGEDTNHRFAGLRLVRRARHDGFARLRVIRVLILRLCAMVAVEGHGTVALEGAERAQRRVDGNLLFVYAEVVVMSVTIGTKSAREPQRYFALRLDLGQVEDVPLQALSLPGGPEPARRQTSSGAQCCIASERSCVC